MLLLFGASLTLGAERLPIKAYSTADGLPHDFVLRIVTDSRGFLWFCTKGGLARFDGYSFANFGIEQGLPEGGVNDVLETRAGEYWVATGSGLMRFSPGGRPKDRIADKNAAASIPMFLPIASADEDRFNKTIKVLHEGADGKIWVGTRKGLYRVDGLGLSRSLRAVEIGLPGEMLGQREVFDLHEDRFGALWVATPAGLYRRWRDDNAARHSRCSRVAIALKRQGSQLMFSLADNGVGFDATRESTGQGLANLRRRAERLNGTFDIRSSPLGGTTVTVQIPLPTRLGG